MSENSKLTAQQQALVDQVLKNLEEGAGLWKQGWVVTGAPQSATTGKRYRGLNNFFLTLAAMREGYKDNRWATFHQIQENRKFPLRQSRKMESTAQNTLYPRYYIAESAAVRIAVGRGRTEMEVLTVFGFVSTGRRRGQRCVRIPLICTKNSCRKQFAEG